jgi:diguanylate cyclase (GGDEF)-like protein
MLGAQSPIPEAMGMGRTTTKQTETPLLGSLDAVERRRSQLLGVLFVVMVGLAGSMGLMALSGDEGAPRAGYMGLPAFQLGPVVLIFALGLYVLEQETSMRRLTRRLLQDQATLVQLAHQVQHDHLTGLPNRKAFLEQLEQTLDEGLGVAVLFCDLDRFKSVNDTFGHDAGDVLLTDVARRLRRTVGDRGTVSRFAGDEFVVLLPVWSAQEALDVAEDIGVALEHPVAFDGGEAHVTTAVGVSVHRPGKTISAAELVRQADLAMYLAKSKGPGSWELFDHEFLRGALSA